MNASDSNSILAAVTSLKGGRGLVEIIALATLLGSRTSSDLILGNAGPAGLVWANISGFGCSSVIKACASAAAPGWLRQMLGLRTALTDRTFGLELPLSTKQGAPGKVRTTLENPLGVSCRYVELGPSHIKTDVYDHDCQDIYAFDNKTSVALSEVPLTPQNTPLTIHTYLPYPSYHAHNVGFQVSVLFLSLFKGFEIYSLFIMQQDGLPYALLTGVPLVLAFSVALFVEVRDIIKSRRSEEVDGCLDILAASPLPTTKQAGGARKVILGASRGERTGPWWKAFWIIIGLCQTFSLAMTYVFLGRQTTDFVLTWAAFQLLWSLSRIVIFKLGPSIFSSPNSLHPAAGRPMKEHQLDSLPLKMKQRVANLVLAAATYQTYVHPRKLSAYLDDLFSASKMAKLVAPANLSDAYTLPRSTEDGLQPPLPSAFTTAFNRKAFDGASRTLSVNILAIIGDTALSSAAWMLGDSKYDYSPMDLYDSCIVVFEISTPSSLPTREKISQGSQRKIIAIPSARVFSARSATDLEASKREAQSDIPEPLFIPRGAGAQDNAEEKEWLYWIPCDTGEWLQFRSPSDSKSKVGSVLGRQMVDVLDDEGVSRVLGAGNLNISLGSAREVKAIVDVSRRAAEALLTFF